VFLTITDELFSRCLYLYNNLQSLYNFLLSFSSDQLLIDLSGMQCNGSDGSRLPGLWDNIATTPVRLPLSPPARDCLKSSIQQEISDQMWITI